MTAPFIYQVYPKSFADSNADGVGDLAGLRSRLGYLQWLGVDMVWMNPIMSSPDVDGGYDISDYRSLDHRFGDLAEFDRLVEQAGQHDISIMLDIVANHTSDQHPWFVASRDPDSAYRDWYVWADPSADGDPPNNWVSMFGGPAWTLDEQSGQYYLHNFAAAQPDLNWWNPEVRAEFRDILRFWCDRGIRGLRIDICHGFIHDQRLRDNPPATAIDRENIRRRGQRPVYNMNRPEVIEVLKEWKNVVGPDVLLYGETRTLELARLHWYYQAVDIGLNQHFVEADGSVGSLARLVGQSETSLATVTPSWCLGNHDTVRVATRWAGEDSARIKMLLTILLTLRGAPVLYYGDELGAAESQIAVSDDPIATQGKATTLAPRDGCRAMMRWTENDQPAIRAWMPLLLQAPSVQSQMASGGSTACLVRQLVKLRRHYPEIVEAPYEAIVESELWVYRRDCIEVAVNDSGAIHPLPDNPLLRTDGQTAGPLQTGAAIYLAD